MKNIVKGKMLLLITAVFIFSMGFTAISQTQIKGADHKKKISSAVEVTISIPDLADASDDKAKEIVQHIAMQRMHAGNLLIAQLYNESSKLSNAQKASVIIILGIMRYNSAAYPIIKNINFKRKLKHVKTDSDSAISNPAYVSKPDPYVARTALESIGESASKMIIRLLDMNPSQLPSSDFITSRVDGFAEVLYNIDGPRFGLLKLQDHQQATRSSQAKAQYQMVIDRFKKMVAQMQ